MCGHSCRLQLLSSFIYFKYPVEGVCFLRGEDKSIDLRKSGVPLWFFLMSNATVVHYEVINVKKWNVDVIWCGIFFADEINLFEV